MDTFEPKVQVKTEHYKNNKQINNWLWSNYMYQINDTLKTNPKKILIIWKWSWVVDNYLKNTCNLEVYSMDIDESLYPDFIWWLPDLSDNIKNQKFDTIICAHVLEHIPFEYFDKSIENLSKICNYLIIQLPPSTLQLRLNFWIQPYILDWNFNINIPLLFWKKYKFDWEHYWQPYRKWTSMKKVKKIINTFFEIEKSYQNPYNHYSYHFILKSKNV